MSMYQFVEFPKKLLSCIAMEPKNNYPLTYRIRMSFMMGNVGLLVICLMYNSTFYLNDPVHLSESLYMLMSIVNCFLKSSMLFLNKDEFLKLFRMLNTGSFNSFDTMYSSIINDFKNSYKLVEKSYWITINATLLFMALCPVLESKSLPMEFPHFNNGTFRYPFYLFEVVSVCISGYGNMAIDLLTVAAIAIAAIQLRILNKKLTDTDKNVKEMCSYTNDNSEKLILIYLTECCMHYSEIEQFVICILKVFSVNIFIQLGISVIAICNSGMMILMVEPFSLEALSLYFYIYTMFAQLGMYCAFGNIVYLESLEVITSCYMFEWYQRGTAVKKTIFMLMERSKRPMEINGVQFVTLSYESFIAILKWSYSYFTLLQNVTMNED